MRFVAQTVHYLQTLSTVWSLAVATDWWMITWTISPPANLVDYCTKVPICSPSRTKSKMRQLLKCSVTVSVLLMIVFTPCSHKMCHLNLVFLGRMWLRYVRVLAIANPSVCRLSVSLSSVTFVHRTQPVEIFDNASTTFCTLAIRWPTRTEIVPVEPLRWG